ncbi:MAG: hypothetical protein QW103_02335 [Candidatus Pacearchaeota archaeon]
MDKEEKKIDFVYLSYYSRKDIQKTIFDFCKKRETVPLYKDYFGKRPDLLYYETDIYEFAKKGATSFHCSQEIWKNPLEIKKDQNIKEINELREGWDFLIDIDSKYFDYAKIAANIIIKALEFHGIENIGIKFSGSKGFHIIIPWEAFPEEISGLKTKDMFPDWPRLMAKYLEENFIKKNFEEELKKILQEKEEKLKEIVFIPKNESAEEGFFYELVCKKCKTKTTAIFQKKTKKRVFRCGIKNCGEIMEKIKEEKIYFSKDGKFNSYKNPELFEERIKFENEIDCVDLVLVSQRHLFRTPYSLHEKTALCSCVLEKKEILSFSPLEAKPEKVKVKNFYPNAKKNEAKRLLINSLDWGKKKDREEVKHLEKKEIDISELKIDEKYFPPTILKILEGMKEDGRKRALMILLSFFVSLNLPRNYIEEKISKWNMKNYQPLKEGYIKSQIEWFLKNKRMPPNYNNPIYKEIGVLMETDNLKNPINYTIRKIFREKNKKEKLNK